MQTSKRKLSLAPYLSRDKILRKMEHDDKFAVDVLIWLYSQQTRAEAIHHASFFANQVGFNIVDARTLTPVAKRAMHQELRAEELSKVRAALPKYAGQVLRSANGGEYDEN